MSDTSGNTSRKHVRPTTLRMEDLSGLTMRDFYPNREDKELNTLERMSVIKEEILRMYKLPRNVVPKKEDLPTLHHELPTLWAMIEEGKFKHWDQRDQQMLNKMMDLRVQVIRNSVSHEDAEKDMGLSLAERYIYPKTGGKR
jgi:hypothetical protein